MRGCKILSSLGQYPLNSSLVDQPRAVWFVDGNSKVNGQHPIFKEPETLDIHRILKKATCDVSIN